MRTSTPGSGECADPRGIFWVEEKKNPDAAWWDGELLLQKKKNKERREEDSARNKSGKEGPKHMVRTKGSKKKRGGKLTSTKEPGREGFEVGSKEK